MGTITDEVKKHIPNYEELFGRSDICECQHCRSVYSPASYLVDIMRFLDRSTKNQIGSSPLTVLLNRRPDLEYLPLTCENTNTIIPYIDLVNEVMEYYVANNNSLDKDAVHDTGDTTAAELRANPQHTMIAAYEKLKNAVFPFSLPYHQPLDVIRTYLTHLKTSRAEIMEIFQTAASESSAMRLAAEYLRLSQEEFQTLTGSDFNNDVVVQNLWEYYGYASSQEDIFREEIVGVPEFLKRTGIQYVDLVELVKTKFINPHQELLDYLDSVFTGSEIEFTDGTTFYSILEEITNDAPLPADWLTHLQLKEIPHADFIAWVKLHFIHLKEVITLFEPTSACDLTNTLIRTLKKVHEPLSNESALLDITFSKLHTFIRLWRKTGWTIHELDVMITALGETEITPVLIKKLSWVKKITVLLKIPLVQLATAWGTIDTYGRRSLYAKLFLNKAVQNIDDSFKPDPFGRYLVNTAELLIDNKAAILAAFRMTDEQFNEIVADSGLDIATGVLNLENLSIIYRYTVLAKALKITVTDLCMIRKLFDEHPFSQWDSAQSKFIDIQPENTFNFIQLVQKIKNAGFKIPHLNYILTGDDAYNNISIPREKVHQLIKAIRNDFSMIEQDHPVIVPEAVTEELVRSKMGLVFSSEITEQFIAMLNGKILYSTLTELNLGIAGLIPEALKAKITYQEGSGRLQSLGVLTDSERDILTGLSGNVSFQDGVTRIYQKPEQFIINNLFGVFNGDGLINTTQAIARFLDHPANLIPLTQDEKLREFYQYYLPFLKKRLRNNVLIQHVAALVGIEAPIAAVLLQAQAEDVIKSLSIKGLSAEYFMDMNFTQSGLKHTDEKIDFIWTGHPNPEGHPVPLIPGDQFSVRWEGFICAPATAEYIFIAEVQGADETVTLWLEGQQMFTKPAGDAALSREIVFPMTAGVMYSVKLEYSETAQDAGIRFYWKTAELPREIVPAAYLYPAKEVAALDSQLNKWQQAAMFIHRFALNTSELEHFIKHKDDFDGIDFDALTPLHWNRVNDYTVLKNQIPSVNSLVQLFAEANKTNPVPGVVDALIPLTVVTMGWNPEYLAQLDAHFHFTVDDFKNETRLLKFRAAMALAKKTGASVEALAGWSSHETSFNLLHDIGQAIKNTVKAKYEEEDWLEVAKKLSDKIREKQKDALISYLLIQEPLVDWGAVDADSLFEYFLIDVQMGACMDTSRIKQAISAVQLFISRCLLNLENELNENQQQIGVTPNAIDEQWMNWMKLYRVWEVNRKIAVYPENWLEPEHRDDKSPFFKQLESELLQNDITERSVENAFRNYLEKLDEVAHLEVCGMYQEGVRYPPSVPQQLNVQRTKQEEENHVLHVFARTHAIPYRYYYRRRDAYKHWTAWEHVQLDIRGAEGGESSGVHLLPVVWRNRLYLFWPEFTKKQLEATISNDNQTKLDDVTLSTFNSLKPIEYWEIKLAWSEYKEGKWMPKQSSKEVLTPFMYSTEQRRHRFKSEINGDNELTFSLMMEFGDGDAAVGEIKLYSPRSSILMSATSSDVLHSDYEISFMSLKKNTTLKLNGNEYLKNVIDHSLLYSHQVTDFEKNLKYPFFYQEIKRGYFVEPIPATKETVISEIKDPSKAHFDILEKAKNQYVSLLDIKGNPELEEVFQKI